MQNKERYSTILDVRIKEQLLKLSDETLIAQSRLIDKALKLLFKEYGCKV